MGQLASIANSWQHLPHAVPQLSYWTRSFNKPFVPNHTGWELPDRSESSCHERLISLRLKAAGCLFMAHEHDEHHPMNKLMLRSLTCQAGCQMPARPTVSGNMAAPVRTLIVCQPVWPSWH